QPGARRRRRRLERAPLPRHQRQSQVRGPVPSGVARGPRVRGVEDRARERLDHPHHPALPRSAPPRVPSIRQREMTMTNAQPAPGSRPPGWQQAHMRRYLETGGKDGHIWEGVPTLLLTTTGRRSGEARTTPLIYGRDGNRYLVVASRGGAPAHPKWYENLTANPD